MPAGHHYADLPWCLFPARGAKRKNRLGGRRKLLKMFDSEKENKGKQSQFLGFPLAHLGWILLDFAKLPIHLEPEPRRLTPSLASRQTIPEDEPATGGRSFVLTLR
jgi:hypothetical protein